MMLHNIAQEVNKNCTINSKKIANFCKPFVITNDLPTENTISTSFSAATEDISYVEIQGFEANFLGKGEVFSEKSEDFSENNSLLSSKYNFQSTLPSQSNEYADNAATFNEFKFSNQSDSISTSINSTILDSALRCLADDKFNANIEDTTFSISDDLPLSSIEASNLNSDASSDHDQQMINCIIKDLYDSRLEAKAMQEEMLRLRKEVDHLMNLNQGLLIYLNASNKEAFKTGFMT